MAPDVLALVAAGFERQTFPFGSVIVREGDAPDGFFVLLSGRARVVKRAEGGGEVVLNNLEPGDAFGESGLVEQKSRAASVRASTDVEVLRLDAGVFHALVRSDPRVRDALDLKMRRDALQTFFQTFEPFGHLSPRAVRSLLADLVEETFEKGQVVIRQGGPPGPLYIVWDGKLQAYDEAHGEHRSPAYYRRGDFFGERSLFSGAPRAATVVAVTPARLLTLDAATIMRLRVEDEDFSARMDTHLRQYLRSWVRSVPLDFAEELLPADAEALIHHPIEGAPDPDVHSADQVAEALDEAVEPRARPPRRIRRFGLVWQVDAADCGAACIAMLCRHFGRRVSLAHARQAAGTGLDGTSLRSLARGARALGFEARAIKASRRTLADLPLPALVHWDGNHWLVLYAVGARHVRVADPALGLRRLPRSAFEEGWSGYTLLATPAGEFDRRTERGGEGWLRSILRPLWKPVAAAALLALALSVLQMVVPVFLKVVVDRVLPERDTELLTVLLLALAALIVTMTFGGIVQRYLLSRAAVRLDASSLDLLTARLLSLPMSYFYVRRTGDIQRRLSALRSVRQFVVGGVVAGLTAVTQLAAAVVLMVLYSPPLALTFLAVAPLYALLMRITARRLRPIFDNLEESFGRYSSRQIDAIKGIEAVKAMGAEERLRAELVEEFERLSRRLFRADFTAMCYEGAVQLLSFAALAVFLWVGALQVLNGNLTVGGLVSFSAILALAQPPVLVLLSLWDELQQSSVLVDRLNDVFAEQPEQGSDHSHLRDVPTLEGGVRLEGVTFRYGEEGSPAILENITLDVSPGTSVAIVGRSGSGKTTLAKCLAGLLEPTGGRILYDGIDMTALEYRSLRQRIGFVLQENYLFSDTIRANIAFGDPHPDADRVRWAAQVANADAFIQRLPLGYETRIGETGLLLSGGQRQRIAIARAIYRRPPVLILDEATSSLDAEAERAVKQNMDRLLEGRTSFVIAHRLSTIRDADLVVVIERGRLVEQGTHDELMARGGLYSYLCGQQLDL